MQIHHTYPLLALNTFGIDASAEYFAEVHSLQDVQAVLRQPIRPILVLGGGSNLLLTRDVRGLVLKNAIQGIRVVRTFKNKVWVAVGGGVKWHDFVLWAVSTRLRRHRKPEPDSWFCGCLAPVQNIGAYGVELKDVLVATCKQLTWRAVR
jgi:UDP-N-acetylmuramate dehydrogenase